MPTKRRDDQEYQFRGFSSPNTTQVPDELFDELLPLLSGGELKALLYIIRRTFGFKKDADTISLSQMLFGITTHAGRVLDHGAGLSKPTLLHALRSLEARGIIIKERQRSPERGNEPTLYRLRFAGSPLGQKNILPLDKKVDQGGGQKPLPRARSRNLTIQETVEQHTVQQETVEQHTVSSNDKISNLLKPGVSRLSKTEEAQFENLPDPDRVRKSTPGDTAGFQPIGELISHRRAQELARMAEETTSNEAGRTSTGIGRGRPPKATPYIEQLVTDFSDEFHDAEHTRQNIGQAARLWKTSGRSENDFCALLYEARSITKQYTVKKRAQGEAGEYGLRNKMPYYFSVLKDLLGLKEAQHGPGPQRSASPSG